MKHLNHRLSGRGSALPPYCIASRRRPLIGRSTRRLILTLATAGLAVVLAVAALAHAEAAAGEVGDHTLDHKDLAKLTPAGVRREIVAGKTAVRRATGVMPVLFRPPYEATDATTHRLIRRAGLLEVLWSVDSRDWQNGSPLQLRRRVMAELHPGGIVLLHEQAAHTLPTLRWLLTELRRRHLRPVTVSQLLADAAPSSAQLLADRRGHACVEFPFRG